MTYQLPPDHVLVLRTSNKDRISYGGFQWPESGPVEAPDWSPEPICGRGLQGALWGEGNGSLFNWKDDSVWQVVEVLEKDIVDLVGKVKFPRGNVVFSGDQQGATNFLLANGGFGRAVIGAKMSNLNPNGHVLVGDYGTANVGDWGTANAGEGGTANAGIEGKATAGRHGTAIAGKKGTANAGEGGTANAGEGGTATAGEGGTVTAGYRGKLAIDYWDGRSRTKVGYIGEDGLEPNTPYKLGYKYNFVKA